MKTTPHEPDAPSHVNCGPTWGGLDHLHGGGLVHAGRLDGGLAGLDDGGRLEPEACVLEEINALDDSGSGLDGSRNPCGHR